MTPKQYTDALARLGLSQRAAARILFVDEQTSRRWARRRTLSLTISSK
jgi:transposase